MDAPARDLGLFAKLLGADRSRNIRRASASPHASRAERPAAWLLLRKSRACGRLVDRMDWQRNIVFAPIAIALLWSAQIAMAIERWRKRAGPHIGSWIAAAGEFEALLALAGYSYEHPSDPFPELADIAGGRFEAEGIAHPLMPESQAVRNDVELGDGQRLLIVSGSNMSGKSTLLRAVGLNTVLAWAGAPVRATRLRISPLQPGSFHSRAGFAPGRPLALLRRDHAPARNRGL